MTASSTAAHPVRNLREHTTALEAAVIVCLADPERRSVHRLRTTTRRIEGQLALLAAMPGVPEHEKQGRRVRRILKKFRRAAGGVRDTDVQIELLDSVASSSSSPSLRRDSTKLHSHLKAGRGKAAQRLLKLLRRNGAELAGTMEKLLEVLEPAQSLSISPTKLAALATNWFSQNIPQDFRSNPEDPDQLHAIRKTAKLARYMAENAPKSASGVRDRARAFESVQEAGGQWHDWLVLASVADKELGSASVLTKSFTRRCRLALTAYQRRLNDKLD
jgi:CHAD domain-containing protein